MKTLWLSGLLAFVAPAMASATIVNIDATHGFNYVPNGGSDPAPVAGDQITLIGTPPTVTLAAGTYTITNATGKPGSDPDLSAWSYNVGTNSWTWGFVVATAAGTVLDYEDVASGSSQASVAGLAVVKNFSSTLTLTAPTVVAFTLRDYYVPDNGGGISLDIKPTAVAVPEPATWALSIAGLALVGGAMRRRRVTATAA